MSLRAWRVALTGGIATGKSHCLTRFAELGVPVVDADSLSREALRPGSAGLSAVAARFGPGVMLAGGLDRAALARLIFSDAEARRALEAIVHPVVYAAIREWFDRQGSHDFAIGDIPLLYETHHDGDFDRVIVAACEPEQQLERLARRGFGPVEARQRLDSQLPIGQKAQRANYVIRTSGTIPETDQQAVEVYEKLKAESRARPNA